MKEGGGGNLRGCGVGSFIERVSNLHLFQTSNLDLSFTQCGGLNENVLHRTSCLKSLSSVVSTFEWFEKVYSHLQQSVTGGVNWGLRATLHFQISLLPLVSGRCKLSAAPAAMSATSLPCHGFLLSSGTTSLNRSFLTCLNYCVLSQQ